MGSGSVSAQSWVPGPASPSSYPVPSASPPFAAAGSVSRGERLTQPRLHRELRDALALPRDPDPDEQAEGCEVNVPDRAQLAGAGRP